MLPTLAVVLAVLASASPASAGCVTAACRPDEAAAVETVRGAIQEECDCAGAASPGEYRLCVKQILADALLSKACRRAIKRCEIDATCGRPHAIVCCQRRADGTIRPSIRRAQRCTQGTVCTAYPHAADACDPATASGCAEPTTTTTSTSTSTSTSSTSISTTTVPPATTTTTLPTCFGGAPNGVRDPGEQCDGGPICTANCRLTTNGPGCCRRSSTNECRTASGYLFNTLYNQCQGALFGSTAVQGAVCQDDGTCDVVPFPMGPMCCQQLTSCYHGNAIDTYQLWNFHRDCFYFNSGRSTVMPGTCQGTTCVPE